MAWTKKITTTDGEPRYKVYWYDPSGAQRSKTFLKSEDARRWERNVEVKKDEGNYIDPKLGKITLRELADRFMGNAKLRPASRAMYEMQLRHYIVPALGDKRLSAITKAHVRDFEAGLAAQGKGDATIAVVHRILHRLFTYAMQEDRIGRNPASLPEEELRRPREREVRPLEREEVETIAGRVSARYGTLVWTLAVSGLRIGEATALRVKSLDLKVGTVRVTANAPEVNGRKLLDQAPKTERGERTVDIPPALAKMLGGHLDTYGNRFDKTSLVFTNGAGHPVLQSDFRRIFQKAAREAKIAPVPRVHDLRHTAASFMADAGYTLLEAAGQLGHSATTMTARYSHIFKSHRQAKVAGLDGLLDGISPSSLSPGN